MLTIYHVSVKQVVISGLRKINDMKSKNILNDKMIKISYKVKYIHNTDLQKLQGFQKNEYKQVYS